MKRHTLCGLLLAAGLLASSVAQRAARKAPSNRIAAGG